MDRDDEWRAASGLMNGGDPGGVEPHHLADHVKRLEGWARAWHRLARKLVRERDVSRKLWVYDSSRAIVAERAAAEAEVRGAKKALEAAVSAIGEVHPFAICPWSCHRCNTANRIRALDPEAIAKDTADK